MRIRTSLSLASMLLIAGACDSNTGPEPARVDVTVTAESTPPWIEYLSPYDLRVSCEMTFTAQATGTSGHATWDAATRRWYAGTDRSTPVQVDTLTSADVSAFWKTERLQAGEAATTYWKFWAGVPFLLEHEFDYTVNGTTRTVAVRQGCGLVPDETPAPPILSDVSIELPDTLEPGDLFRVSFRATAQAGLWQTWIDVRGAYRDSAVVVHELRAETATEQWLTVPAGIPLGSPITVSVQTWDALGQQSVAVSKRSTPLVDVTHPELQGLWAHDRELTAATQQVRGQWAATDTMQLFLAAYDNHLLAAAELRFDAETHAVELGYPEASNVVYVPLRAEWIGASAFELRVVDQQGLASASYQARPGEVRIYPERAQTTTQWDPPDPFVDVAWDDRRDRIYIATTREDIVVASSPGFAVDRRIPLPADASSIDMNTAGDTLLVTLPARGSIAFVDLRTDVIEEIPIAFAADLQPQRVALLADRSVLLQLWNGVDAGRTVVLEPHSGVIRSEIAGRGAGIGRSRDGSVAAAHTADHCFSVFRVATGEFEPCRDSDRAYGTISFDAAMTNALIGHWLLDLATDAVTEAAWGTVPQQYYPAAFGADDGTLFLGGHRGIMRARVSDGVILERWPHTDLVSRIIAASDGTRILSIGHPDETGTATLRHVTLH